MSASISTTVTATVEVRPDVAFEYIVPIDLRTVFKGYRLLPGVKDTSVTEGWNKPGLTRTVTFTDGSTSTETLLTVVPNSAFTYKNEDFTAAVLRFLICRIDGRWQFEPTAGNRTFVTWTYTLVPNHTFGALVVRAVLLPMVHGMLVQALGLIQDHLARR